MTGLCKTLLLSISDNSLYENKLAIIMVISFSHIFFSFLRVSISFHKKRGNCGSWILCCTSYVKCSSFTGTHPTVASVPLKMLHYFGALKSFVPGAGPRSTTPHTESWVSALHYRITALVFLVTVS